MEVARMLVLIPTFNNMEEIDVSLQSVWNQDYDKENIYITAMDFGSTDGTYEKLLRYDSYHFGVYQNHITRNSRLRISQIAKMTQFIHPGGHYAFQVVLYPGDKLYPDFMETCNDVYIRNWGKNPTMVICEADLFENDHTITHQPPLFLKNCVIDGSKEITKFISRGYQHQIQCMGRGVECSFKRFSCERNERVWWNKLFSMNLDRLALYIRKPLVCQKKVTYEDETEEILLRWESIIAHLRGYSAQYGKTFDDDFEENAKQNLAEYALWRSWLLRQGGDEARKKETEDCFLLSGCISPSIKKKELYKKMEQYVMRGDDSKARWLSDYFATHGMN